MNVQLEIRNEIMSEGGTLKIKQAFTGTEETHREILALLGKILDIRGTFWYMEYSNCDKKNA